MDPVGGLDGETSEEKYNRSKQEGREFERGHASGNTLKSLTKGKFEKEDANKSKGANCTGWEAEAKANRRGQRKPRHRGEPPERR